MRRSGPGPPTRLASPQAISKPIPSKFDLAGIFQIADSAVPDRHIEELQGTSNATAAALKPVLTACNCQKLESSRPHAILQF